MSSIAPMMVFLSNMRRLKVPSLEDRPLRPMLLTLTVRILQNKGIAGS